jgi:hypothetical protein
VKITDKHSDMVYKDLGLDSHQVLENKEPRERERDKETKQSKPH